MLASVETTKTTAPEWMNKEVMTGTTILAVQYKDGVIIAADSRTTSGSFVSNRVTDKLTPLAKNIFCLRSGSAADTQAVADVIKYQLEFHEMQTGETPTVHTAAYIAKSIIYNNRDNLLASIMVAGWDSIKGGQVYVVPISGMIVRRDFYIGGSGSVYAMGFLDATYRPNMNRDECIDMVKKAIAMSIARDGSSGGCTRYAIVTKDGVERNVILNNELMRFHEQ